MAILVRSLFAVFLLIVASAAGAQGFQWSVSPVGQTGFPVQRINSFAIHDSAAVDASGNLFIAGSQFSIDPNPPSEGIAGIFLGKYAASDGHEIWRLARPGATGVDGITAVAIGPSGDLFVVGTVHDANGDHMLIARVSGATGDMMWQAGALVGDGNPSVTFGFDIRLDTSGNVWALGTQRGTTIVAKIDANNGDILAQALPATDHFAGSQDPVALRVAADGNLIGVTFVDGGSASEVFKISSANGVRIWTRTWTYRIAIPGGPEIRDFTVDPSGNPVVVGRGVAKFSGADGTLMWEHAPFGNGFPGTAFGATTASNGDVIATGTTGNNSEFMFTARLAAATGVNVWSTAPAQFDSSLGGQTGKGVALDPIGDTIVGAQIRYANSTNFELQMLEMDRDGVVRGQSARFAPTDGTPQADMVFTALRHGYLLGRVVPASGPARTVALKYAQVHKLFSIVGLASSANPTIVGQPFTLTATITPTGPVAATGTVMFHESFVALPGCEAVPVVNNTAACTVSTLPPGKHDLTALYSGDADFTSAASSILQTVNNAPPGISLATSANPANFEQPVTFTAMLSGSSGTPTGTVAFRDNNTAIGGCAAVPVDAAGSATCTLDGLMPGSHPITAAYAGDNTYGPGTSSAIAEVIQGGPTAMPAAWHVETIENPTLFADVFINKFSPGPRSAVDADGNTFLALSSATATNPSTQCMVFVKYARTDGHIAWRRSFCNASAQEFSGGIAVDARGDALVTGVDGSSLFVAKLAGATGSSIWEQRLAPSTANIGMAIGLDAAGNARVAALGNPLTIFAFANADGSLQWQRALDTGLGSGSYRSFAVDAAGNVAVSERHQIDTRENVNDVLTRIDGAGNFVWRVIHAGGFGGLAFDAAGNVVATSFSGLQKFDAASGAVLWTQAQAGGFAHVDALGNIFVLGNAPGSTINTARGMQLAKLDGGGNVLWSRVIVEDPLQPFAADLALDASGNPVVLADGSDQEVMKFDSATGHMIWLARDSSTTSGGGLIPRQIHAIPNGVVAFGDVFTNTDAGPYVIAYNEGSIAPPPPPPPQPSVVNLSTRGRVGAGDGVLIGGFVIGGSGSKTVVVTAAGPALASAGIANALGNPRLTLVRSSDGAVIAVNDDWQSAPNAADIEASGFAPANALEPAIMLTLPPGAYTAIVDGVGGTTGVAVVGIFEVDHPEVPLVDIATRGQVLTGEDVMIGGFVIQGTTPQTVVVTGIGPALAQAGIANPLANPTLTIVRMSDNAVIATNDDWGSGPNAAQIQAAGLAPTNASESAVMLTLDPGAYTAIVSGVGGGTGVGLVAVYRR